MEISIFKKKLVFFLELGKKAPKFYWEWGRISAPENTKNIPVQCLLLYMISLESTAIEYAFDVINRQHFQDKYWQDKGYGN